MEDKVFGEQSDALLETLAEAIMSLESGVLLWAVAYLTRQVWRTRGFH